MCKSVPQMAVEVRRMSTSVDASRRASSTVSISSVLSPRQTTAFISFLFFLQTALFGYRGSESRSIVLRLFGLLPMFNNVSLFKERGYPVSDSPLWLLAQ